MIFGIHDSWVLAPTRAGAHNWEGIGLKTAFAALDALADLVNNNFWKSHPQIWRHRVDSDRVVYTGHSMVLIKF